MKICANRAFKKRKNAQKTFYIFKMPLKHLLSKRIFILFRRTGNTIRLKIQRCGNSK